MPSNAEGDDRISELRPNRRLLDPNFDCYRLASEQLKVLQHKFKVSEPLFWILKIFVLSVCHHLMWITSLTQNFIPSISPFFFQFNLF